MIKKTTKIKAFAVVTMLYSAINYTHEESYSWRLLISDTISFANNPHRILIFAGGLIALEKKEGEKKHDD